MLDEAGVERAKKRQPGGRSAAGGAARERSEAEHLLEHGQRVLLLLGRGRDVADGRHRAVQELGDDAPRQPLNCLNLFLRKRGQPRVGAPHLLLPHLLGVLLQLHDLRHGTQRRDPSAEGEGVLLEQHLGCHNFLSAFRGVPRDDGLQGIDIIRRDVLHSNCRRVDISRHGDVHQHQAALAVRHRRCFDDEALGGGSGEN
mmetsp:Transcript_18570/g.62661  ORF Transcript_18570/g.62661 Transcript_18570/m.62661 type:complete len:200 (+) Transcript_18570:149-748(+)